MAQTVPPSAASQKKIWIRTPLIHSAALSAAAGCQIYLKLENLQPCGSFKMRGIGNYLLANLPPPSSSPAPQTHFYCSSGGNAGLACVHATRAIQQSCTIVVPVLTPARMVAKLRAAGATDVVQIGATWSEADRHLREVLVPAAEKRGERTVYVPPFDAEAIWEGNSTLVEEIIQDLDALDEASGEAASVVKGRPDALLCSVGGGGLFNGVMRGLDRARESRKWALSVPVLAIETEGADSLYQSVRAGELVTLPKITSIAISLGASRVSSKTFEYAQRENVTSVALTDAEAAMGVWRFADDERILVEPACAVCLSVLYLGRLKELVKDLRKNSRVVIVVCGGCNITTEMIHDWRERFGDVEGEVKGDMRSVPSSYSAPGIKP